MYLVQIHVHTLDVYDFASRTGACAVHIVVCIYVYVCVNVYLCVYIYIYIYTY